MSVVSVLGGENNAVEFLGHVCDVVAISDRTPTDRPLSTHKYENWPATLEILLVPMISLKIVKTVRYYMPSLSTEMEICDFTIRNVLLSVGLKLSSFCVMLCSVTSSHHI